MFRRQLHFFDIAFELRVTSVQGNEALRCQFIYGTDDAITEPAVEYHIGLYQENEFYEEELVRSACLAASGGGTGPTYYSCLVDEDTRLLLCCGDQVFCLQLPELKLLWQTQADSSTCFGIKNLPNQTYIVHGELEITCLDLSGCILWQFSGGDIFTTLKGDNLMQVDEESITVKDWNEVVYKLDWEGKPVK